MYYPKSNWKFNQNFVNTYISLPAKVQPSNENTWTGPVAWISSPENPFEIITTCRTQSRRNPSCYRSPWNLDYCVIAVNSPLTGWISIPRRTAGWFRTAAALGCLAKDIMHHHPHRRGNVPVVIHAITPPPPLLARPSSPEWNGWSTFINITGLCGFHQHQDVLFSRWLWQIKSCGNPVKAFLGTRGEPGTGRRRDGPAWSWLTSWNASLCLDGTKADGYRYLYRCVRPG